MVLLELRTSRCLTPHITVLYFAGSLQDISSYQLMCSGHCWQTAGSVDTDWFCGCGWYLVDADQNSGIHTSLIFTYPVPVTCSCSVLTTVLCSDQFECFCRWCWHFNCCIVSWVAITWFMCCCFQCCVKLCHWWFAWSFDWFCWKISKEIPQSLKVCMVYLV